MQAAARHVRGALGGGAHPAGQRQPRAPPLQSSAATAPLAALSDGGDSLALVLELGPAALASSAELQNAFTEALHSQLQVMRPSLPLLPSRQGSSRWHALQPVQQR